ncbi:deaminase domain-containing protein [Bacillus thuringiensis]|nr:deaminase domain-containing protein [Bacillus thuringiensis]
MFKFDEKYMFGIFAIIIIGIIGNMGFELNDSNLIKEIIIMLLIIAVIYYLFNIKDYTKIGIKHGKLKRGLTKKNENEQAEDTFYNSMPAKPLENSTVTQEQFDEAKDYINKNPIAKKANYASVFLTLKNGKNYTFVACSKLTNLQDEERKHYENFFTGILGEPVCLCTDTKEPRIPIQILDENLEFIYVSTNSKDEYFKDKGYQITAVKNEFMDNSFESTRVTCTERKIINHIFKEFREEELKLATLKLFTDYAPCLSCYALLKNEKSKFEDLKVYYNDMVFTIDIEEYLNETEMYDGLKEVYARVKREKGIKQEIK